jgi:carboxymethylenebutenolidase
MPDRQRRDVERMLLGSSLAAGNRRCEIVLYPDTPHAFHADHRPSYRQDAAVDGWRRCLAWFKANGVA